MPRRSVARDECGVGLTEVVIVLALLALMMGGVAGAWGKAQEAYFVGLESAELQQNVRAALDFMAREIRAAGRDATVCAFDFVTAASRDCDGVKVARCAARLGGPGTPAWDAPNGLGGSGCVGVHAIPFAQATATTLRVRSDRNHNGRIAGLGNAVTAPASAADRGEEDVLYALSTASCPPGVLRCVTRDDGTGPTALVAVDIDELAFTYYPRAGFGPCAGLPGACDRSFALPLASQAEADTVGRIRISVTARQRVAGQTLSRTLATEVTLRNRS